MKHIIDDAASKAPCHLVLFDVGRDNVDDVGRSVQIVCNEDRAAIFEIPGFDTTDIRNG